MAVGNNPENIETQVELIAGKYPGVGPITGPTVGTGGDQDRKERGKKNHEEIGTILASYGFTSDEKFNVASPKPNERFNPLNADTQTLPQKGIGGGIGC